MVDTDDTRRTTDDRRRTTPGVVAQLSHLYFRTTRRLLGLT